MGFRAWRPRMQKVDDRWLVVHEHASLPFGPETGLALVGAWLQHDLITEVIEGHRPQVYASGL